MRLLKRYNKGTALFQQMSRSGQPASLEAWSSMAYLYTEVPREAYAALEHDQPMHKLCHAVVSTTSHGTKTNTDKLCCMKGSALYATEDI